jgi:hypothetical protein
MCMFKTYNIVLSDGQLETELTYSLSASAITQTWAGLISRVSPSDIRPYSTPWRGVFKDWDSKVKEINQLIEDMNIWIPDKIQGQWNDEDRNESLNRLHIHFPELEKTETDRTRKLQLSRYNDLIHEMQVLLEVNSTGKEQMQLVICPEGEQAGIAPTPIPNNSYWEFTHNFSFGDLVLHYCHVGRHPYEIFTRKDTGVPEDQIIPQSLIYTYHSLRFFDSKFNRGYFNEFYFNSKIKWPYKLTDPKLAFGYVPMGKLTLVNGKKFEREETYQLIKSANEIVSWQVG